jgi:DNA-binding LacI/PurR family transcriptional regulator/DNA-binding transcriptional regulator YhcF (GntR family)
MKRTRSAKYAGIRDDLLARIRRGVYPVGSALPGRHKLAAEYGVAYGTLDRAVRELAALGLVRCEDGRGSFVTSDHPCKRRDAPPVRSLSVMVKPMPIAQLAKPATLGLVTLSNVHPSYDTLTRNVEAGFSDAGGTIATVDRHPPGRDHLLSMGEALGRLRGDGVAAFIVLNIIGPMEHADRVLAAIDIRRTPTVLVTWDAPVVSLPHVYYDHLNSGFAAAEHLVRRGYRRLVFVAAHEAGWVDQRQEGARQAALAAGEGRATFETLFPDDVPQSGSPRELASAQTATYLERYEQAAAPLGFIVSNDEAARGVLARLEKCGLQPGRDVGVIGFDDDVASGAAGLSSVRPGLEDMARNAVRMVIDMLNGDPTHFQVCCPSQVIARRSTLRSPDPERS